MTAGPSRPELLFERADVGDVEIFAALERKSAGRLYGPIGTIDDALREITENVLYLIRQGPISVGTAAYRIRPDNSVYISCLNVDPLYRRRGIARAAMAYLFEQTKGARRVDLVTHPENEKALQLYLSLGFRIELQRDNYFGDGEPRLVLAKEM